jgi:hypothetical protein
MGWICLIHLENIMKYFLMFVSHEWMTIFVTIANGCMQFILFINFLSIFISPWWRNVCEEDNDKLNLPLSILINASYQRMMKRFELVNIVCVCSWLWKTKAVKYFRLPSAHELEEKRNTGYSHWQIVIHQTY